MDYLKFILASKMGPGPLHGQPFGKVSDKWQLEDYEGVLAHKYSLIIRGRNHDKTGKLARLARARLILSKEQEQIYAVARDRDQIEILKDDIDRMNQEDTRTRTLVKSTRDEIVLKHSPKSRIRFLPHDAPSAYGLRPSMIICDEMATWAKPDLWRALWTATGKNPRCTVAIISVPPPLGMGILSELMELAKDDPEWFFSWRQGVVASWITESWVAQMEKSLQTSRSYFLRQIYAIQTPGDGAWLNSAEIENIFQPMPTDPAGEVAIGLDVGYAKDRAYIAVVQRDENSGVCCVRHLLGWEARGGERVDLQEVETEIIAAAHHYGAKVFYDRTEAVFMMQRAQAKNVLVDEYKPHQREEVFTRLLDVIRRGQLRCFPHPEFKRELFGLVLKETIKGFRVDHTTSGHDDATVAVALAISGLNFIPRGNYLPEVAGYRDTSGLHGGGKIENMPSPSSIGNLVWSSSQESKVDYDKFYLRG